MSDPFDLERFVRAQEPVYAQVVSELRRGRKDSHWMWFVFPQLKGLGQSSMALRYGIASLAEARSYLDNPILGPRLRECTALVNARHGRSADEIFGYPDDMKFRSSMTLFAQAASDNAVFLDAIREFFDDKPDPLTLERLQQS